MKNTLINLLGISLVILLLASCAKEESENVNQDSIYSIYELFYNVNSDKTTARATFRFGGPTGTLLQLNPPAASKFDGDALLYNELLGMHSKEYAGFKSSGTFTYVDLDNNTFTNPTPTIATIDYPAVDTIYTDSAYTFTWTGTPIASNETVTLTIDGTQQNNFEVVSSSTEGVTELIIPASKLQNLGVGNATFTLQRAYNVFSVHGTSTGGRMALWYTIQKTIYIDN